MDLIEYFERQNLQFELSETDYWINKQYWYIKKSDDFIGFILINGCNPVKDETEPEGWVFWTDNYNTSIFAEFPLDESFKKIAYEHVDIGTCGGGLTVNLFGQVFAPVCNGTTFRFDNPSLEEITVLKKLVELKILDLQKETHTNHRK